MSHCSECGKAIGYFPPDNPPVCRNGRGVKIAKPTAIVVRRERGNGVPSAGSLGPEDEPRLQ